jgi:tetratricopeptide (TPR) repeat protein
MGDEYKVSGQAGAAGDNAHVHDNTFIQNNYYNQSIYTALHQLPPPSADFVGREKEMTELLQALEKGGVTISGLQGMGGIGKTALALKLAEQLKPNYPDAQFYLDLKGTSKESLSAKDAMAHVIRSYHPEAKLPEDESGLQGLYLSLLESKKALLLMDNATSAQQVKPLIPPAGSIMLITSRNLFTLSGFFIKNLNTLEPEDAKQLLLKIAPRISECADRIAALCGYLPLALEVAASAINKAINLAPDEYVVRLSKAMKRLELVEASLSLSYELLSDELKKLWRLLSVFPNTFDDVAAAALWKMSVEDAQDRLAELISYSLIEWNETTRRYRLHDLVRLFADRRLSEQERLAVKKIHATYFKDVLTQTSKLYLKGGDSILSGLALYDLERENVEAALAWAASLLGQNKTATILSSEYYYNGAYVFSLRLHPREQIRHLEVAIKAAHLLKDKRGEGIALSNLGIAYKNLGEYRKAIEFYEKALLIAQEIGDHRGKGNALCNLGNAFAALGDARKAIVFHEQYLAIVQEIGDPRSEGIALSNLGIAYKNLGEYRKAIEFYEKALLIAQEIGDRGGKGNALCNLGNVYLILGEMRKAIEFYEQALLITHEIGDRRGDGAVLCNLGSAYAALGETRKAIEFYEQQLVIAREIGDRGGEGTALCNLGSAYAALGETRKAIEFYEQQLVIAREIGDRGGEGIALWNSALDYSELGERSQAILLAEMALAIFVQIESPEALKVRSSLEKWKSEQA